MQRYKGSKGSVEIKAYTYLKYKVIPFGYDVAEWTASMRLAEGNTTIHASRDEIYSRQNHEIIIILIVQMFSGFCGTYQLLDARYHGRRGSKP